MSKEIVLKNNKKMSINALMNEYIRPDFVYIPLVSHVDTNCSLLVKKGDKVSKGSIIGKRVSDEFPIISTVSGVVTEIRSMLYLNGKMVDTVVIKNDFKEKSLHPNSLNKDISDITKEEFIKRLKTNAVTGLSGNDFSTYIKYSVDKKLKILLINGTECEPYITSDYFMMRHHSEEILETIDAIITIMELDRAVITFKDKTKDIKFLFNSIAGTYPNIEIITTKDYYPVGWERTLIKDTLHLTYNSRASEVGVITSNVSTIYEIYETLKYDKPMTERYITISGEAIKEPQNILVKIGSRVGEVLNAIGGYEDDDKLMLIANGALMGKSLPTADTMVVKPLTGIIVRKYVYNKETSCINCGKCVDSCPTNLSPVLIMKNKKNIKKLKKLESTKCIHCGLCSYVCPAKINVREEVISANKGAIK